NLAPRINSAQEVVLFLEDFCLSFTDADDAGADADKADENELRDPRLCENPFIVYRQLFAEWNTIKRPEFLGPDNDIDECMSPVEGLEIGPQYVVANDRTFDQPQIIYVNPSSYIRLRII